LAAIGIQSAIFRFSETQPARLQSSLAHSYQHLPYSEFLWRNSSDYFYGVESLVGSFTHSFRWHFARPATSLVAVAIPRSLGVKTASEDGSSAFQGNP
jgi:hypothetical protein